MKVHDEEEVHLNCYFAYLRAIVLKIINNTMDW